MFQDLKDWYVKQALFTRTYITIAAVIGLIVRFKPIIISHLIFDPSKLYKLQIWRLFTHYFILGKLDFHFVFSIVWCLFAVRNCEGMFEGTDYADFYYMLAYLMAVGNIVAYILDFIYLAPALQFALIYIWCKRRPFETVRFYFSIQVKSQYFPWVLMGFNLLLDQDIYQDIVGLAIGQSYLVLKDYLPVTHSYHLLNTPKFFANFVNKFITPYAPFAKNYRIFQQGEQAQPRFFQGQGRRLG